MWKTPTAARIATTLTDTEVTEICETFMEKNYKT